MRKKNIIEYYTCNYSSSFVFLFIAALKEMNKVLHERNIKAWEDKEKAKSANKYKKLTPTCMKPFFFLF
jgi:hypothetical protein